MHLGLLVLSLLLITPFATAHAQSPALSPIGDVTVNAGDTVTLNVVATDGGNGEVTLSSSLPLFAELNSPRIGIGQNCRIDNTIIDKNARIGDGVVISPKGKPDTVDHDMYYIRDGVVIVPKSGVIPHGTII